MFLLIWRWFTFYERTIKNAGDSQLGEIGNFLLQEALERLGIKKRETITWTNLPHTAFVLMIEYNPDLRETSKSRKKVKTGKYDLVQQVEIH